jgi:hypothetical protein
MTLNQSSLIREAFANVKFRNSDLAVWPYSLPAGNNNHERK